MHRHTGGVLWKVSKKVPMKIRGNLYNRPSVQHSYSERDWDVQDTLVEQKRLSLTGKRPRGRPRQTWLYETVEIYLKKISTLVPIRAGKKRVKMHIRRDDGTKWAALA